MSAKLAPHRGFNYVGDLPAELICSVCKLVCTNAVIPNCGHQQCKTCAAVHCFECGDTMDKADSITLPRHLVLLRAYDNIQVECIECKQLVERGFDGLKFKEHIQLCSVECPLCEDKTCRGNWNDHLNECPLLEVGCAAEKFGCQWRGPRSSDNSGIVDQFQHQLYCHLVKVISGFQIHQEQLDALNRQMAVKDERIAQLERGLRCLLGFELMGTLLAPYSDEMRQLLRLGDREMQTDEVKELYLRYQGFVNRIQSIASIFPDGLDLDDALTTARDQDNQ